MLLTASIWRVSSVSEGFEELPSTALACMQPSQHPTSHALPLFLTPPLSPTPIADKHTHSMTPCWGQPVGAALPPAATVGAS